MQRLILLVFTLIIILFSYVGYTGHYGYDDMHYAELSHDLSNAVFHWDDHYAYRWTILAFTAVSYKIFGVSDFASGLPPLLFFLATLFMLYSVLKKQNSIILILGLSLSVFCQWYLFYSNKIMPDVYVAFASMLSLFAIYRSRFETAHKTIYYSFTFAVAFLFGFLSKGTFLLITPLFLYLLITDLILKRQQQFWFYSFISGFVLFSFYFTIVYLLTGNPLSRFTALESNAYQSLCSYGEQPISMLLERISVGLLDLFNREGMIISYFFIFAFLLQRRSTDLFRVDTPFSFFYTSSIVLLVSANFMSISLRSYNPMCLDVRHYLFLIPIAAIPASRIIYHFMLNRIQGVEILCVISIALFASYFGSSQLYSIIYSVLFMLFAVKFFVPSIFKKPIIFTLAFALILLIVPGQSIYFAQKVNYSAQREFLQENLFSQEEEGLVITDDIQMRLGNYYNGFDASSKVKFVSYYSTFSKNLEHKNNYILSNPYTSYLSQQYIPYYAEIVFGQNEAIEEDKRTGIKLYKFESFPELIPLLKSNNDFEKKAEHWTYNKKDLVATSHSGKQATSVLEYSPTFNYTFDSIFNSDPSSLIVSVKFNSLYKYQTEPQLVCLLLWQGNEYHREYRLFNHYIKSIDHWWKAETEVFIRKDDIRPESSIMIYFWNPSKKEILLDDIELLIQTVEE